MEHIDSVLPRTQQNEKIKKWDFKVHELDYHENGLINAWDFKVHEQEHNVQRQSINGILKSMRAKLHHGSSHVHKDPQKSLRQKLVLASWPSLPKTGEAAKHI